MSPEHIPVEYFAPTGDRAENILAYPYARPEGSFITDGREVVMLPNDYASFIQEGDDRLQELSLPRIEHRIPVLAYGSNAAPHKLAEKMNKFPTVLSQEYMHTAPHFQATLPGMLAVWHGRPGQIGGLFAELMQSDNPDTSLTAHIAFLTLEQVAAIHTTEGATYTSAIVEAHMGGSLRNVLAYVALNATVLQKDGKPVLVNPLKNEAPADHPRMAATEGLQYMLDSVEDVPLEHTVTRDALTYVADGLVMPLVHKKTRQAEIGAQLLRRGVSTPYAYNLSTAARVGRADITSLLCLSEVHPPCTHEYKAGESRAHLPFAQMPEMALTALRPTKKPTANKYDPVRLIARRAHDERMTN